MSAGREPTGESFADEAYAVTVDAYGRSPDRWERAVPAAIARLFGFLADRADQTKECILADHGAGSTALARRDRVIARFTALLEPGFEAAEVPPPPVVAEAIGGGIYELVRSHVLERRLQELPAAVPSATVVVLTPFMGSDRANELARSENVQAAR